MLRQFTIGLSKRIESMPREFVGTCFGALQELLHPYRPELYYMRGPGPKWQAKNRVPS